MILFDSQFYSEYINKTNDLSNISYIYSFDKLLDICIGKDGHTYSYQSSLNETNKTNIREP